jgi:hypothetical protein
MPHQLAKAGNVGSEFFDWIAMIAAIASQPISRAANGERPRLWRLALELNSAG